MIGGVGVDSAWDYGNQANLSLMIKASGKPRSAFFITSKVPAGDHMPGTPGVPGACAANPNASLAYVRDSLRLLGVGQLDLVLIHSSCANYDPPVPDAAASDNALWQGLMQAKELGLTRAIGVSNFNAAQLQLLKGETPAVNQIAISIMPFWGNKHGHDDVTLEFCAAHSITPVLRLVAWVPVQRPSAHHDCQGARCCRVAGLHAVGAPEGCGGCCRDRQQRHHRTRVRPREHRHLCV